MTIPHMHISSESVLIIYVIRLLCIPQVTVCRWIFISTFGGQFIKKRAQRILVKSETQCSMKLYAHTLGSSCI